MKSFGPPRNGIRPVDYAVAIRGPLLTDARIDHYARKGRYGAVAQANATPPPRRKRVKKFDAMAVALRMLE